jgi:TPR repeat protein
VAPACQDKEKEYIDGLNKACSAGELDRCADLGESYLRGMGVQRDTNKGVEVLRKACNLDGAKACSILSQAYSLGEGVAKDITQANQLQGKACEDGDEESCVQACDKLREAVRCLRVGVLSAKGAKDPRRAATYYRKACELGHPLGCREAGIMYQQGMGVPQDTDLAGKMLKKADELMRTACAGPTKPEFCGL